MRGRNVGWWIALASALCVALVAGVRGGTPKEWKQRTIYQLLTDRFARPDGDQSPCDNLQGYCGGTFRGIEQHLDYITGMGFDAIWISPIVVNTPGGYHGYWLQNLYGINPYFGTEQDLQNLVAACHARGVWVMLDVVANHVGPVGSDFSSIVPWNQSAHYHSCSSCPSQCTIQQYSCFSQQIETCRTSGLPDLNQTRADVAGPLLAWVAEVVQKFGFDGLRIDTVPEIAPSFWGTFQSAAGVYAFGEVYTDDFACIGTYNSKLDGVLSYPLFFSLRNVFEYGSSMYQLNETLDSYLSNGVHIELSGVFLGNHDQPRFLSGNGYLNNFKAGLTWVLTALGIPIVYYGQEQQYNGGADPNNREPLWTSGFDTLSEMYLWMQQVVTFRKKAQLWQFPQVQRYADDQFYAFTRGATFVALTNQGSGSRIQRTITYHPYSDGTRLCNLFWPTSDCVTVAGGSFVVILNDGESKIYSIVNEA